MQGAVLDFVSQWRGFGICNMSSLDFKSYDGVPAYNCYWCSSPLDKATLQSKSHFGSALLSLLPERCSRLSKTEPRFFSLTIRCLKIDAQKCRPPSLLSPRSGMTYALFSHTQSCVSTTVPQTQTHLFYKCQNFCPEENIKKGSAFLGTTMLPILTSCSHFWSCSLLDQCSAFVLLCVKHN